MHRLGRVRGMFGVVGAALAITIAGTGALAPVVGAHGRRAHTPPVIGHLYVNDNTAPHNTVAGFDQHPDGSLTPIPGSPFAVGGAGKGTITGSAGALQVSPDGRYVLAVDAGSNQISVLRVQRNGALQPVAESPVASGGIEPVSITVQRNLAYVANEGNGTTGSNYTGFRFERGRLTPLADVTVPLPADAHPGQVLLNQTATRLIGTRVNTSSIDSFVVGEDGRLTAAPNAPYAAQGVGPFGSAFRPTNVHQLFVSNAHNGGVLGTVSAFNDTQRGVLTPIGASPYADGQSAPCWVAITPNGAYLFAVNAGNSTISRYAIARDGVLTLLGSIHLKNGAGLVPFDMTVDRSGHYAYTVDAGADTVSAFHIGGDGSLTELPTSPMPLPAGATPFGIAIR